MSHGLACPDLGRPAGAPKALHPETVARDSGRGERPCEVAGPLAVVEQPSF
ncbi:MAG TPA: hypothetical protein PKY50_12540 [Candidatus Competibacter sp.]|nr:hypothetical protein [Candidatus Competibacter sp.]